MECLQRNEKEFGFKKKNHRIPIIIYKIKTGTRFKAVDFDNL